MNKLKKLIFLMLISVVMTVSQLWSGTTGKIAGTVTDKATGEALIGANIVVVGTSLGGATDVNGQYSILSIPPGTYSVQISYIGYKTAVVNDVRVFIDQTARIDINLEAAPIEVGETVVMAERNIIKLDVATSVVAVSSEELADLPVSNVTAVMGMQAGINNNQIRGIGLDQALFLVDGVTMRDPRNNQAVTSVALSSIREISIERGGFNAEYGQVQSGIVNVVTNEGKIKGYSGSINLKITPPASKYYRGNGIPDIQNPNSYWLKPYFDPAVCWTGTNNGAWDEYTKKQYLPFDGGWNAISKALCTDANPNNDLTPIGAKHVFEYETRKKQFNNQPDYDIDAGFGGPVPFISQKLGNLRFFTSYRRHREMLIFPTSRPDYLDYDWRLLLNSDIAKNMKLSVSGITGNVATMAENWNYGQYRRYPGDFASTTGGTGGVPLVNLFGDMTYSITDIGHRSLAAKLTHALSAKTYYEVSLEYFRREYNTRPPAARDTSQKFEILPGFFETSNPLGYFSGVSDGIIIKQSDQQSLARDSTIVSMITFKADMTSQIDFNNMVKAGVEFNYNDLNLDYGFIQMQTSGNTYANRIQMHNFPIRASAYMQDKLETKGFTLNAGLRLDYSNSRTDWWSFNPYDPNFYGYKYNDKRVFVMQKSEAQWQLSPRLGISHPITENSKLYFNYGHFKQMPQYETLFRVSRRRDNSLTQLGDPNLTLAKTISYELGYDHQLFDNMLLIQLTAYYRDISDQQTTTTYNPKDGSPYQLSTSNRYQDIRGFELTIRKSQGRWFYGFVNYTYQTSSRGDFGKPQLYEDPSRQKVYDETTTDIYQTRYIPTPFARANLNFSTPEDFGPTLLRHKVFGDIMLNLLLNWTQGGWTTYNPRQAPGASNNVQYVDYFDGTLRASKSIALKHFTIQLFVDISNLFNALRLSATDGQDYRESLHLPKSNAYDNIPGDDKLGDYRKPGVEWVPIEIMGSTTKQTVGSPRAVYYEPQAKEYWHYVNDQTIPNIQDRWKRVDKIRIEQINRDKAYIDMPNPSTFWFLNPRNITYGLTVSFDLD
jgi:outer membrane receptor protein involved in Fe transport